jgi:hypothetical protein
MEFLGLVNGSKWRWRRLGPEAQEALEEPKGRECPERIGRRWLRGADRELRESAAEQQRASSEHGADENELSDLDAEIESEERNRQIALRQTDLREGSGKAEAVQQSEAKRHHPWPA